MKNLIFTLILVSTSHINNAQIEHLCSIFESDNSMPLQLCINDRYINTTQYSYLENEEAYDYVSKFLELCGVKMNIIVSQCPKINNAYAMIVNGKQHIAYDGKLLESLNKTSNKFQSKTVLSHEIGHHLNGHTIAKKNIKKYCKKKETINKKKCLKELENQRNRELEADYFAGFIMKKHGAKFEDIKNTFRQISNNTDDLYSTHPKLDKRLHAAKMGFDEANFQLQSGKIVSLDNLKEKEIDFEYAYANKRKTNRLIRKIEKSIALKTNYLPNDNTGYVTYIENQSVNKTGIITDADYYKPITVSYQLANNNSVKYGSEIALKVKNGILKIEHLKADDKKETLYISPFDKDEINLQEIQLVLTNFYSNGIKEKTIKTN